MKCEKNSIIELSTSKLIIALTQEIVRYNDTSFEI